ncbi:uncharacterized protein BDR25DRAFT_349997 [Lindgomyces ingoldianus]|uniref:Uncharacterized protein n=1 Tax=Lindgomyces ingoldianus TaxID=673940 RepID=A0ACB6R8Y8_9PLEO|nr:uncharacterized protein BDR25DRAFT_349997 [Lindgomyces ingoldianus]KAF2475719.1 hypothetical protein BDR25DRAFT_349997 [Lindgomyces ingoldianus]
MIFLELLDSSSYAEHIGFSYHLKTSSIEPTWRDYYPYSQHSLRRICDIRQKLTSRRPASSDIFTPTISIYTFPGLSETTGLAPGTLDNVYFRGDASEVVSLQDERMDVEVATHHRVSILRMANTQSRWDQSFVSSQCRSEVLRQNKESVILVRGNIAKLWASKDAAFLSMELANSYARTHFTWVQPLSVCRPGSMSLKAIHLITPLLPCCFRFAQLQLEPQLLLQLFLKHFIFEQTSE